MKTSIATALLVAALTATTALTASAQEFNFRFDPEHFQFERGDERATEGKRAACTYYAQIAVVQADTNRRYNCGYSGPAWNDHARDHFRWCRFVRREATWQASKERAQQLQECFNRMGDFDEERDERREHWR
jgi:hypothetical protein